ncbi:hypothetical protein MSP8887_02151 [Marinomonas spartinae]|uniref:hypothetical protein n=1 Tax=Marinomonas spartinae TaxID=1792290 RepID=UPI000808E25D|nr:hypothetical protein [Marinomonas spartinae]SBS34440.1 hypothetical protein MSP8887_02151 [Marinomonas spartinae]
MPGPFLNQRPQDVIARQRFKSRLEKDFKQNRCDAFSITKEEFTCLWVETQKFYGKTEAQIKEKLSSLTGLSVTDSILSFTANYGSAIKDSSYLIPLINDFKRSGNILGRYDIIIRNGREYVTFKGNPRLRNIIRRSRYLLNHTKMIEIGIGKEGVKSGAIGGFYIAVFFSITLDTINWIFKDNYRWTNWLGTVSTDIVKAAISIAATLIAGTLVSIFSLAIVEVIVVIGTGLYVGYELNKLDGNYHITDSVIKALNHIDKKTSKLADETYKVYFNSAREVISLARVDVNKIGLFYNNVVSQGLVF